MEFPPPNGLNVPTGYKGKAYSLQKIFLEITYLVPNAPHPDRHHIKWGKPRRKNIFNGLRDNDHHLLQFSTLKAPENDLLEQLSRDSGTFFKKKKLRICI